MTTRHLTTRPVSLMHSLTASTFEEAGFQRTSGATIGMRSGPWLDSWCDGAVKPYGRELIAVDVTGTKAVNSGDRNVTLARLKTQLQP